jgi:hypothetical protein
LLQEVELNSLVYSSEKLFEEMKSQATVSSTVKLLIFGATTFSRSCTFNSSANELQMDRKQLDEKRRKLQKPLLKPFSQISYTPEVIKVMQMLKVFEIYWELTGIA